MAAVTLQVGYKVLGPSVDHEHWLPVSLGNNMYVIQQMRFS